MVRGVCGSLLGLSVYVSSCRVAVGVKGLTAGLVRVELAPEEYQLYSEGALEL